MTKWVYSFGAGHNEGRADMKNLLGGKGANLAEMASIGLPVPPGFTITTEVCTAYYDNKQQYPAELKAQVSAAKSASRCPTQCDGSKCRRPPVAIKAAPQKAINPPRTFAGLSGYPLSRIGDSSTIKTGQR